jgi:hypothetical protein
MIQTFREERGKKEGGQRGDKVERGYDIAYPALSSLCLLCLLP